MKKLLNFVLLLTICAVYLPLVTVGVEKTSEIVQPVESFDPQIMVSENQLTQMPENAYDEETVISLWSNDRVMELTLSEYLAGVLAAEVPAGFPEEALKAQAVAARTYTLYKRNLYENGTLQPEEHHGAELCDDPGHCEAFTDLTSQAAVLWGGSAEVYEQRIREAVTATDGLILVYEEEPIAAVFCAAAGEKTESAKDIWGSDLPYLISVESPGGQDCSQYEGKHTISQLEFTQLIQEQWPEADFSDPPSAWFRDSHRSEAGSVLDVLVGGVRISGSQVRQVLGLNSANFKVKVEGENLVFSTIGYGHGVGLSQYGARYLAMDGQTYDQILAHYYPETQLQLLG